jgi:hypothetical protein
VQRECYCKMLQTFLSKRLLRQKVRNVCLQHNRTRAHTTGQNVTFLGGKVPSQFGGLVVHHVYRTLQPQTFSGRMYDYATCPGCNQKLNKSNTGGIVTNDVALLQRTVQNLMRLQKYITCHVDRLVKKSDLQKAGNVLLN